MKSQKQNRDILYIREKTEAKTDMERSKKNSMSTKPGTSGLEI